MASLPPLIGDDGRIRLSIVLTTLFPEQKRAAALTAFRQFRARLAAAATDAGRNLSLEADTQTRTAPEERWCWFEGADGTTEAAARHTEAETRDVMRIPQEAVRVGKRTVRYFISYAHRDEKLKNELHLWLGDLLGSANDYDFKPWQDGDIPHWEGLARRNPDGDPGVRLRAAADQPSLSPQQVYHHRGTTALRCARSVQPEAKQVGREAMRGTGEGHRPWDLQPQSTMTNGNIDQTAGSVEC
jgi:hypothetical protein